MIAETACLADAPVLIAGAGPVGLVVALELAHHGVRSILVDRSPEPTRFPKMDVTNGRSMELFRRLGLADRLREIGVASHHSFDVILALPDVGPVGVWPLPSVDEQRARIAARNDGFMPLEADQRAPQSRFEQMGRELCRASPLIDFREGVSVDRVVQHDDGVEVTATDIAKGATQVIRSQWLVAADGAGSRIRNGLGIGLDELGRNPSIYMVHFRSRDLAVLNRHGPFWHYFAVGAVIIAQDSAEEWTFHCPLTEPLPASELDPAEMIARWTGFRPLIDEVLLTSVWQPRFCLAERYSAGRIFLAGDAVHQVFPVGGYGMNTGVGDAIDIGWKLAAVVNGWAGRTLLDSYDAERRPVGATNRQASMRHLDVHIGFIERARAGATLPQLKDYIEARRGENEFDGIEFGYRYEQSPVIVHEEGPAPRWSEWDYVPSTWPGARPPSFILEDGTALFDRFGKELTLVDFKGDASVLIERAADFGIPVTHLPIDEARVREAWERDYVLIRPDHHVAWRAAELPDEKAWIGVLKRVTGAADA